jgi:hypothetical protein
MPEHTTIRLPVESCFGKANTPLTCDNLNCHSPLEPPLNMFFPMLRLHDPELVKRWGDHWESRYIICGACSESLRTASYSLEVFDSDGQLVMWGEIRLPGHFIDFRQ